MLPVFPKRSVRKRLFSYENAAVTAESVESASFKDFRIVCVRRRFSLSSVVYTETAFLWCTGSETLSMSWCKEILTMVMQNTPHSWSSLTLMSFPQSLADFFQQHQAQRENKAQLKRSVEEEYRKWKSESRR